MEPADEVLAEHCAVSRLDLLPLRCAPVSQEAAQTARLVTRAMDLSALVFEPCSGRRMRGHVQHFGTVLRLSMCELRPVQRCIRGRGRESHVVLGFLLMKEGMRKEESYLELARKRRQWKGTQEGNMCPTQHWF